MHRLGPYLLLTRIGVGGMAEIFLARRNDEIVALKRILPHLAAQDDFVDMFVDEARLAARLRHPNIARVLEVGLEEGIWYIAMEYVPGEDLLAIIRRAREKHVLTPVAIGAAIIADAASALHHAHESRDEEGHPLGLVHRDVTPSNLLVSHEGVVKLVDFGIAKAERRISVTAAGALKGKYAYMAPEHALGQSVDRRADVFSLGVVAWELFTQKRLFHRDNELAVLRAVTEERVPVPSERRPDLPAELDEIIMRALDRNPETRYPTARHLEVAMRSFATAHLGDEPQHAIADFMDRLFGVTVAEKRRRWAAGDLDDEPETQVESFGTPPPTTPRSRVPDPDLLADIDDDLPEPETTVAPLTPARAALLPRALPATIPEHVRMTPAMPAFPADTMRTEPVPRLSGGPRALRVVVATLALAGAAGAVWIAVRPSSPEAANAPPALLPRPLNGGPTGPEETASLEVPQLGTGERKRVTAVARPGAAAAGPSAQLTLEGPDGATVLLDGEALGVLPLVRRSVPAGLHTITIASRAPRFSHTFALDLRAGAEHIEVIRVDPATGNVVHDPREKATP